MLKEELRSRTVRIRHRLMTIHPNPGPATEEERRRKRERRKERRKERRQKKLQKKLEKKDLRIATWNVQRMSLGTFNKRKAKSVAAYAEKEKWDLVLLSEVRAERKGVEWLGEGEHLTAIIHSKKAGILIRGPVLQAWCEEGQVKKCTDRSVSIKVRMTTYTAVYIPVFVGNNQGEREQAFEELKQHKEWASAKETLLIGGDFNSSIGKGEERPQICGKFGLRETNRQGQELLNFCEENNLAWVNSFYSYKNRGSWFSNFNKKWYELDGFLMRCRQRHKNVKKISTVWESTISDHKPKLMIFKDHHLKYSGEQRKKRRPRINFEKLRDGQTEQEFRRKVEQIIIEKEEQGEMAEETSANWNRISSIVNQAAMEVCGMIEKKIENPWMVGKEEEITRLRGQIQAAITRRNQAMTRQAAGERLGIQELLEIVESLKVARKHLKRETARWEREWWESIIEECERAADTGQSGVMYKKLAMLGRRGVKTARPTTDITKEEFKEHFAKVSKDRFENDPAVIDDILREVEDIRDTEKAREWRETLEETPQREEIVKQMRLMKDSAPGQDGTRLSYILKAGPTLLDEVIEMVQFMFENPAHTWEKELKVGLVCPLFKKGDINNPNNYRGVCLLPMGSRILARIMADRLRIWAEHMDLLDDNQAGFRKGRSTADVTQLMLRIWEDTEDLRDRIVAEGGQINKEDLPAARLLDLRKAYPRVNKYALWKILEMYGMGEKCLRVLQDIHETTEYKITSREGESEPWVPMRGLREGDPSSPPLFNIYHQVPMRIASKKRKREAQEEGTEAGIEITFVPGSSFPGNRTWEKFSSENKKIRVDNALFADDTTGLGVKKELDKGIETVKEVMMKLEEKNNDDKEEEIIFGEEGSGGVRVLGSYLGQKEDVRQRKKRAGNAWRKVKHRLKGTKLSKRMQARVIQAVVESTMLFDCQVRVWRLGEVKQLQSMMDRMYRYVWSDKNGPPLIQMQREQVNMQDVRNILGVRTVRYKIEKRCLERIGHVFRLEDDSTAKIATLGWLSALEEHEKRPGKKRKTILYWKQLLREAGIDYTKIGEETRDRKVWKRRVMERMDHIAEWERNGGNLSTAGARGDRRQQMEDTDLTCTVCQKICESKAGLTVHIKRIHEVSSHKVTFKCDKCNLVCKQEANLKNHMKACTGAPPTRPDRRRCAGCRKEYTVKGLAAHRRRCQGGADQRVQQVPQQARIYRAQRAECPDCGMMQSKTNMSRHKQRCPGRRGVP